MNFSKFSFITFTVTQADPAVFTSTAHELYVDDTVVLETTSSLLTGLAVKTTYWVVYNGITADTFQLSTWKGGTPIATTGTQAGTHSYLKTNRASLKPEAENNK